MPEEIVQGKTKAPGAKRVSLRARALDSTERLWRPAGTVIAIVLALLVTWHVVYGNHGLSIWQQKRVEDRALQQEI